MGIRRSERADQAADVHGAYARRATVDRAAALARACCVHAHQEGDGTYSTSMTKPAFRALLEEILRVPPGQLSETDTRESVENWSSLADVEILTVIASELGVDAESLEYESVGELLTHLEDRQVFSPA